jgi:hypothetical protein
MVIHVRGDYSGLSSIDMSHMLASFSFFLFFCSAVWGLEESFQILLRRLVTRLRGRGKEGK